MLSECWRAAGPWRDELRSSLWWALNGRPLKSELSALGVRNLRPWNPAQWHRGNRYFTGLWRDGSRVFVKVGEDAARLADELAAYKSMVFDPDRARFCIELRDSVLSGRFPALLFSFEPSRRVDELLRDMIPPADARRMARDLVELLDAMDRAGVLHRDLSPSNLLDSGRLLCFDFAFALVDGQSRRSIDTVDELHALGTGYRPAEGWDDAFSATRILDDIERACAEKIPEVRVALESRVGRRMMRSQD